MWRTTSAVVAALVAMSCASVPLGRSKAPCRPMTDDEAAAWEWILEHADEPQYRHLAVLEWYLVDRESYCGF